MKKRLASEIKEKISWWNIAFQTLRANETIGVSSYKTGEIIKFNISKVRVYKNIFEPNIISWCKNSIMQFEIRPLMRCIRYQLLTIIMYSHMDGAGAS